VINHIFNKDANFNFNFFFLKKKKNCFSVQLVENLYIHS